jgi:predicted lipid-binding transport protein (Tim44 family)
VSTPSPTPPPVPSAPSARAPRPAPATTAGAPGLTAAGVVVVVFAASLVGMLLDVFTGSGVGWLFGGFFIVSSAYAAMQVRRADRAAALIAPPLVFAVLVMADEFIASPGQFLSKAVSGVNALLDYGPMLWIGCGLTVLIIGFKVWQERRPRRSQQVQQVQQVQQTPEPSSPAAAPAAVQTEGAPPQS